ncbi:ATP-binding cassette domain-containing protein [Flavobacterium cucumis]|uniref:ABC-2 type transport system ATP-binding protein n=1 Tax=Flavobacterium cucumis TaxID=416016 RepID=A0A1M7ZVZ7_9FLAO|nr:ABC transporter ATP-binding protein [Flavobacterium cucumis]SHO72960.1 ABC-2 type transport system ATP-binding protein [Flavobacterium cucumis]
MTEFEKQFRGVQELLEFNDFNQTIKRVIDFTLDTENIEFYRKTIQFLDWLDQNDKEDEEKESYLKDLLGELYTFLSKKECHWHQTIISVNNLQKAYNASFLLGPINLEVKTGEIIGLVGENGNGKTTLLRCLCGELHPTSGSINYQFAFDDFYDLRTKLVYIPQRTETWRGSMYENLEFTASCYGYLPEENNLVVDLVIARLGLRKYRKHYWNDLSSGYKMRFELARMLLRKPKILLIDEPLANLDILAQQTILDDFRNIANSAFRPIAIVLSSQQLYEVEKTSNQVVFLKRGSQKNLNTENDLVKKCIIEFESSLNLSDLKQAFSALEVISLEQNGGTFIATFPEKIEMNNFLKVVIDQSIPMTYMRNISNSTRRFFVN